MPNETLIEIATRHQSHFERLKTSEVSKFDSFLLALDKSIRLELTRSSPETISQLNAQLKQIEIGMKGTLDEYEAVWLSSIDDASIYEAGFEHMTLGKVVDGVNFKLPSDSQILAAVYSKPLGDIGNKYTGMLLKSVIKDFSSSEIRRVQNAIRLGFSEGLTTGQILKNVRGTKVAKWTDGTLAQVKQSQDFITRTALQHASNTARNSTWKDNSDIIDKVRISATLDQKTSSQCRSLDGQEFPIDKGIRPPFHGRCRTTTVAVLKRAFLQKGGTRSARDPVTGKVVKARADTTYYGWLRNQPANVQDSIIGKTRGKLLRNGGISSERFAELQLGKNFEPLTLDQMRKLEPIAFEKANIK